MKTPLEFSKSIKNGIVTEEIMGMVIYSFNKRAKNYRDKERMYRGLKNDQYGNEEKNRENKEEMYEDKEYLLSLLKPTCIHKEIIKRQQRIRYYDHEEEFYKFKDNAINRKSYFDRETQDYIEFIDVLKDVEYTNYYLFYKVGNFSFHSPIEDIKKYNLEIIYIGQLTTEGKDINDLLSVQFCAKVIDGLKDGRLELK